MDSAFSIAGLVLTSASAIWLLWNENAQRSQRGNKLMTLATLRGTLESRRRGLAEIRRNLQTANDNLDPTGTHIRYPLDDWTAGPRAQLTDAERKVADAEKALQESAEETWPKPVHILAFVLLVVGFLCQLIAEILRAFS